MSILRSALAALVIMCVPRAAGAQVSETGDLTALPFSPPWVLVVEQLDQDVLHYVYDEPYDECVAWFRAAYEAQTLVAPGWRISGVGWDTAAERWVFGLQYDNRVLYDVAVLRDVRGCAVDVRSDAHAIPGGRWRWSYPPLRLSDETPVDVDPLAPPRQ
ncbi:MAG: hypothetical protein H6698_00105 [Myxococcales bacterium]|nr:hypothetical protein [Myxococcales bacterium]MCB9532714.1 hypothetical protein [Myxococcales bacterium]